MLRPQAARAGSDAYELMLYRWPLHRLKQYLLSAYVGHALAEMRRAMDDMKRKLLHG